MEDTATFLEYMARMEEYTVQLFEVRTDEKGHELTEHGVSAFPAAMYQNSMGAFASRSVPWHWHEECELIRVRSGCLEIERSGGASLKLNAGEGAFINQNVLHSMHSGDPEYCTMTNILFRTDIISGAPLSVFRMKYVEPLAENANLPLIAFTAEDKDLLKLEAEIENVFGEAGYEYEMRLRNLLSELWLLLLTHGGRAPIEKAVSVSPYIRPMLSFIHEHFSEALTLEDIAQSAGISKRTCSRCFREQLGMSAFEYLVQYRIERACSMLMAPDKQIIDVCLASGFSDLSYFTRTFHEKTGMSPGSYRRFLQENGQTGTDM